MKALLIIPALVLLVFIKYWVSNYRRANRKLELDRKALEAERAKHDRISRMNARKSSFKKFRK